jgi:predicted GIY-YIG superfamily endonuclease
MAVSVYWIHLEEHTDMFRQGYIGVSNNTVKRFEEHKNRPSNAHLKHAITKYGWDKLIKTILLVADEAYCLLMEYVNQNY